MKTFSRPHHADERFRLAAITRLYLVVLGRAPDPSGLAAYINHLRDGRPLAAIAEDFVRSDEFLDRVRNDEPRAALYRHALGPDAALPQAVGGLSLGEEAASLVLSATVGERLAVLQALYPDGVPLAPTDYRMWLLGRPMVQPAPVPAGGSPALSIVIISEGSDLAWLAEAVQSVLRVEASLELLVAVRWPASRQIREVIGHDARVRLVQAPPWSSRAGLFNHALARCAGMFTGLIGQHDQLDESAAALPAMALSVDIVITDDDQLDQDGVRQDPRLGTAWDPDRTIAAGCTGLLLLRTTLLRRSGGMRSCAGREEWAMLLRVAAATEDTRIVHVPVMALSRRIEETPGPFSAPHAAAARAYFHARKQAGAVRPENGVLRVTYPLPTPPPVASVIVPTRDRADLLRRCMDGLLQRTDYPALEIVVVDNGSTEPDALTLLQELARDGRVRVLPVPGPFNWSALNNAGVAAMQGEVAVLLNNDTDVLDPSWLHELVSQAMRPEVGVVGAKLFYEDGRIQHAGVVIGPNGRSGHMWRYMPGTARGYLDQLVVTRRASALTGACLAIRRDIYLAAGGCEAEGLAVTWNDVDLCFRIRALGLQAIWTPYACLLHSEQATRGTDDTPANQERFWRERAWMRARWGNAIDHDPFWNRNLLPSETEMRLVSRFA